MDKRFKMALVGGSFASVLSGVLDGIQGQVPQDFPAVWNQKLSPYLPSNGSLIIRAGTAGIGELARRKAKSPNMKALGFGMELWSLLDEAKIVGNQAAYAAGHGGVGQNPASWTWPIGLSYRGASPSAGPAERLPFQSDMTY